MQLPFISPNDQSYRFPDVELAHLEPDGLLAFGGDLSPQRLLNAYALGIFPWFNDDQPILWWSPNPRLVLIPQKIHRSRSLKKTIKKSTLHITYDQAFKQVIEACSQPREKQKETWISRDIKEAYFQLHQMGYAHSFEAWDNDELVGGLYGIAMGQVFFGESMFSLQSNASKIAFSSAVQLLTSWGYQLIDCQVETEHLQSFGAENIDRTLFSKMLAELTEKPASPHAWQQTETET